MSSRKSSKVAEKKTTGKPDNREIAQVHSTDALLHELQVHQLELEMQNETLRYAQTLLETSRDDYRNRFVDLYDFAPVGYLTLTCENLISEINLTAAAMLGVERKNLILQRFPQWMTDAGRIEWQRHFQHLKQHGGNQSCELQIKRSDGSTLDARLNCLIVSNFDQSLSIRIALTDNSIQKQAEAALQESQRKQRELAKHLELVREEERSRIAREIHDELGSFLTMLKLDLSWLDKQLPLDLTECHAKTQVMVRQVNDSIQTVKRIITDLHPSILDHLGLFPAIEWQVENFRQRTGIQCLLTLPDTELAPKAHWSTSIFRIVQETLTNILTHANASELVIVIELSGKDLLLTISDNGVGMTPLQQQSASGFGIHGMHERAQHFGGELNFISSPEAGTTVKLRMPLPA